MKKTLLLMGLGAFICSASVSAAPRKNADKEPSKLAQAQKFVKKINTRSDEGNEIWRPGTKTSYYWNGWSGEPGWELQTKFTCTYNEKGLILEELCEDEGFKNNYEYDEEGRLVKYSTSFWNGEEYQIENLQTFEYDSVVKDLVVLTLEEYPSWGMSYGYGLEITRNDLGNITNVKQVSHYNGESDYSGDELIVEYGSDNKACKITSQCSYPQYDDEWEPIVDENGNPVMETEVYEVLSDIVWECTDGQIYEINLGGVDIYNPKAPNTANRISSCTVYDSEWEGALCNFTGMYEGLSYIVELKFADNGETVSKLTYASLDDFGSFTASVFDADYDDDENGNLFLDGSYDAVYAYVVDAYGNLLEMSENDLEYDENGELIYRYASSLKGEVEYDPDFGYPLEYISSYMYNGDEEYIPQDRVVYSDYTNVAETVGVKAVESSSADAPVEFYNLNGVRVSNPADGIFIRRQGNNVSKVIVK